MSYISLYRKWRPRVFEDVVEQEHVVRTLRNSVITGHIAHAYLFCGTRGTGKTSMAHIFSRAINCLKPVNGDPCNKCEMCSGIISGSILDVIEIDAASNNSVDNVREIRDEVIYAPSQAKYKVYIIDEVHMLSTGAFNALLKTLEEPPSHVVFILATTEPHKLPATVLSRCQRFDFKRITAGSIIDRLDKIAQAGGVTLGKEAARLIARLSDGALRDAISILDQCISTGSREISYDGVLSVAGAVNDAFIADVIDAVNARNIGRILELTDKLVMDGRDIAKFLSDLVFYYRNLLICKITGMPDNIIDASGEAVERMKDQCTNLDQEEIMNIIKELSALESRLKWVAHPRILLEVALIRICDNDFSIERENILERLDMLERQVSRGTFSSRPDDKAGHDTAGKACYDTAGKACYDTAGKMAGSGKEEKTGSKVKEEKPEEKGKKEMAKENVIEENAVGKADTVGSGSAIGTGNERSPAGMVHERKVLENWNAIINELRSSGKMVLYSSLSGTKAIELDSKFIGIVFGAGSGFNKMLVTKTENLEIVESLLSKKLGREIRVKCIEESKMKEYREKEPENEKDDFLKKAQDIAKRLNAPLNVIDE